MFQCEDRLAGDSSYELTQADKWQKMRWELGTITIHQMRTILVDCK